MNLNQSVLREALQNHNILVDQTPRNEEKIKSESKTGATQIQAAAFDSDKLISLNTKIDDIYSSLSSLIETHCTSKSEL